ncbi:MAG: hypothetical protein ACRDP4_07580, partial [Nocardioidaceae bacterium]
MSRLVGFDVGRTHCRAYLIDDGRLLQTTRTPAVPTPVDARSPGRGGVVAVAGQLRITVQSLCPHGVDSVVAGFPGLLAAPDTATALAEELARQLPGTAAFVTSDLILAHAALLGGSAGA